MKLEEIYSYLPVFAQTLACNYYGWREKRVRMGSAFHRYYDFLLNAEWASVEEIKAYQDEQVAMLISHAYGNVPYYRRIMDEYGLKPNDITSRDDIRKLPILRKQDVFENAADLRSRVPQSNRIRVGKTSGSTGTALKFNTTLDAVAFQWAVWWRYRARFGFMPGDWHVNFTARPVVPFGQSRPPFWRVDYFRKQIIIPAAHLIISKVNSIKNFIESSKAVYITGYASQVKQFCDLIEQSGISLNSQLKAVLLGAEKVDDSQRAVISKVTGAIVSDQYGFAEAAGNASRCPWGNYHEDWEFGILDSEKWTNGEDDRRTGKILATGFSNYEFPFIRYEVGDTATWELADYYCSCGRKSRVISQIEGRNEDFVITPEGNRVMRFDYLFKDTPSIQEAQVIQRELGSIIVRFVPRSRVSKADIDNVERTVKEWISPSLEVSFEQVHEIDRSPSGKFRAVLSELPNGDCIDLSN